MYHENKIDKKMKNMSTMKTLNELPTKLNGKLNRILTGGHTYRTNNAIILNVKMLVAEYPNNIMLKRIGKSVTSNCSICKIEDDTNEHLITTCAALNNGLLKTQVSRVKDSIKSLQSSHQHLSLQSKQEHLILLPTLFNLKVKLLTTHLKETRELIHRIDNFRNLQHGQRTKFHDTDFKKLPDDERQHNALRGTRDSGTSPGTSTGKSRGNTIIKYLNLPQPQEQMPMSNYSTISDQYLGSVVNSSSMLYILSVMTPTGRRIFGKYGQMRPSPQETGLEDVCKVVSIVANSTSILDSLAFYSSHEYNVRNCMKISEMGVLKVFPDDFEERLVQREKSGWKKGSVNLLGLEKDRNKVLLTTMVLRGHPSVEIFCSEKTPSLMEIYVIDPKQARRMSRTDSLRISPRVFIGQTRTFRFLQSWMEHLCDDTVVGRMPSDLIGQEFETSILAGMEVWRPGSTSYLQVKFTAFLHLQGPMAVERLRTRGSWDYEDAGAQFTVANLTNPMAREIDMSKSNGDSRDRSEEAIRRVLDNSDYSDDEENDVFNGNDRTVKEEPGEYFEDEVKKEPVDTNDVHSDGFVPDVKREISEDHEGKLTIKRERLDSKEYIQARRMGDFVENQLKVREDDRKILAKMEATVKLEQSEGQHSDTSAKEEATYESEPADTKMDYKDARKRGRSDSEEEWLRLGIKRRLVELSDAQFEELMQAELETRKSVKKRIAKKIVLKRLQRKDKKKSTRRARRRIPSSDDSDDSDTDTAMEASGSEQDVKVKIDHLLAKDYGQETLPVQWHERAKSLNDAERKHLAEKLTSVIDEMSGGNNDPVLFLSLLLLLKVTRDQRNPQRTRLERLASPQVRNQGEYNVYECLNAHKRSNVENLQRLMKSHVSGPEIKEGVKRQADDFIYLNIVSPTQLYSTCFIILDDSSWQLVLCQSMAA